MTAPNGRRSAQAIPIFVFVPQGVRGLGFQVVAQWFTDLGILCPPQQVNAQPIPPQMILKLFVDLVNQGLVHQVYTDEQGQVQRVPLPQVVLEFGKLPEEPKLPIIVEPEA